MFADFAVFAVKAIFAVFAFIAAFAVFTIFASLALFVSVFVHCSSPISLNLVIKSLAMPVTSS
jgi:hypothetical protein